MTCSRGASALEDVLKDTAGLRLRVFVVWEPVIASDIARPTSGKLSILRDPRVVQYWDPQRAVSQDIVRAILANPSRYELSDRMDAHTVVWDVVAVFPPGVVWSTDIPVPIYHGEPVVHAMPGLRKALSVLVQRD